MASAEVANSAGIGAPVRRLEDRRFLTGQGRYVDDMALPNMAFAHVVRSPHAHARIVSIDKSKALKAPGVLAVLTGEDTLKDNIHGIPCNSYPTLPPGAPFQRPTRSILATEFARHVGDCVALVVADTLSQAKDASELLDVQYEPLPAVTLADALAKDAPKVWQNAPDNVAFKLERGDGGSVDQKFANAAHVTKLSLHYPCATANSMEPRAALACRETDGRYTLYTTCQTPFRVRDALSTVFGISDLSLRIVAPDVGGGFGMKSQVYPEEALVLWATMRLGRPVKWTGDRGECIANDSHGRHQMTEAALALNSDGRIVALRVEVALDLGAYLSYAAGVAPHNATISYTSTYDIPLIHAVVRAVFTNTSMTAPYRGTGKPEASFVIERLVDKAARELNIDPIELRRRNIIPPSAMPYQTPGGYTYDSGEFENVLDKAIALADWKNFPSRRAESSERGLRRGIGLALHCQRAGNQPERMEIRVAPNGTLALHVGTHSHGQGHETVFAQMMSEWLGVAHDQVRVFQGDTDKILYGRGTFSQRSMIAGGSALKMAADEVIKKGKRLAGYMLEASATDIEFKDSKFRITGTDRAVSFAAVAKKSYMGAGLPAEFGVGLDGVGAHPGPNTFPNGCMICEVEVDPDTGNVKVLTLSAVDDSGVVVNPLTLEGQLHGSTAQGLGEALFEQVVYDRQSGQLLSGSFMDYAMPRAGDMPFIVADVHPVPAKTNLLGVKGGSEAGNGGAPPAIIHAIIDALSEWDVRDIPLPATPEHIWRAIHSSASAAKPKAIAAP
jgi:carbon-monoxide dehydrogenase large subunit